jgi:adenylylsulfate kinase
MIFLDGRPFSRRYQIENLLAGANALHQRWRILECVCSEETARGRLQGDAAQNVHLAGNRNFELYLQVKERFEWISVPKAVIDTDRTLDECISLGLAALLVNS